LFLVPAHPGYPGLKGRKTVVVVVVVVVTCYDCWLGGSVVERRSLIGELSLVSTGLAADG